MKNPRLIKYRSPIYKNNRYTSIERSWDVDCSTEKFWTDLTIGTLNVELLAQCHKRHSYSVSPLNVLWIVLAEHLKGNFENQLA